MNDHELWDLVRQAYVALASRYDPVAERIVTESGVDARTWGVLLAVLTFDLTPSPLHPPSPLPPGEGKGGWGVEARWFLVRGPYTAIESYLARLQAAASKGYLAEVAPGQYRLTETGRAATERFVAEVRAAMAQADPLPHAEAARLASLLDRLVQASLHTPPPPDTWSISLADKLLPAADPPLPYSEQLISCLLAYRDDAHLAAWRPSGLSATALEALTLLWRGEAGSLEVLYQKLAPRGHPCQVYAQALAELRQRGFITGPDEAPRLTPAGQTFRDQVEATTERYFFAPWGCLNAGEEEELAGLLIRMRDGVRHKERG
jgi:hypothetical protein